MTIDINVAFHEQGMADLESLDLNLAGGRRPGLIPELGKLVEGRVLEVLPALQQMHRRCAGWQSSGGIGNLEWQRAAELRREQAAPPRDRRRSGGRGGTA